MTLSAEDVRSLIEEVRADPALRQQLRDVLFADDMAAISASLRRITEQQELTAIALRKTDEGLARLTERLDALAARFDVRLANVEGRLGNVEGEQYEFRWERHLGTRLGRIFRRVRPLNLGNFAPIAEAFDDGRLSQADWDELFRLDVTALVTEAQNKASPDIVAAIELSRVIDSNDVERASRRATILNNIGVLARGVVGGESILADAAALAVSEGVTVIVTKADAPAA